MHAEYIHKRMALLSEGELRTLGNLLKKLAIGKET
jgi:hypothetical protein